MGLRESISLLFRYFRDLFVITFYIGLFQMPITSYAYLTQDVAFPSLFLINLVLLFPGFLYYLFRFSTKILSFVKAIFPSFVPSNIEVREVVTRFSASYGSILVFISLAWLYLSILFSYAYMSVGYSFIDSVFESVSGLTTSGLSVVYVDKLSPSLILFRSFTAWIGGIGILAFLLATIRGLVARVAAESFEISEFNIFHALRMVLFTYLFLSLLSVLLLISVGFTPFESLNLAMAGISNNGFYPFSEKSLSLTQKDAMAFIMFLGSLNILIIYSLIFKRNFSVLLRGDFLFYLFSIGVLVLSLSYLSKWDLHTSLLTILTTITGGGFGYLDFSNIDDGIAFFLSGVMLTGAMAVSTGGGIKNTRVFILLKLLLYRISGLFLSDKRVKLAKVKDRVLSVDEALDVSLIPFSFLLLYFFSTCLLLSWGFSLRDSTILTSTSLGNVGISTVDVHSLEDKVKWLLILNMYLGRLEVIPAFALIFSLLRWKR